MTLKFKSIAGAAVLAMLGTTASFAAGYPDKPVKILVAYQAGQGTDTISRYVADHLTKALGQTFYVENKGGAGGNIGTQAAARAEPDGYTLTMGTNATHNLNAFLYSSLPFDPVKDFDPVILVGTFPMVLVTKADSEFKTTTDIINKAKSGGRTADIGMPSTTSRLVYELLKEQSGAPLFGVPYKGSSMAMTNVIGGEIPLSIDTVTASGPQIAGKKLRAVAVTSKSETKLLPGVPTVASQGLPGFEVIAWNALFAPKGTPTEVVTRLNLELQKFFALPETQERLLGMGLDVGGGTPKDLANFVRSEQEKWEPVIKKAGIKIH
ncbi:Bug family tripartite tricarboxylate transporter substrate binding protein [Parapusillimonas sp. JC17]|uniref:Bug family tripartite tricarboxylate transporter substrate binding protein n=1 Tax=Parapusillimonas sp. JC17 TaxID=3445768 RepID=UPI003F9ED0C5